MKAQRGRDAEGHATEPRAPGRERPHEQGEKRQHELIDLPEAHGVLERLSGEDDSPTLAATLGEEDAALEGVEYRESLQPLLATIPARERRILILRFFGNMTQSQIASELGISQMHVSRLLARTLAQLREGLTADE